MSVARFIADQRAKRRGASYDYVRAVGCQCVVVLQVDHPVLTPPMGCRPTPDRRRAQLDPAVAAAFKAAKGLERRSPRLIADLRDLGWEVSEKTVADSMRRQGLVARRIKRRNGLTKQDKTAPNFPTWSNETSPRLRRTGNGWVSM